MARSVKKKGNVNVHCRHAVNKCPRQWPDSGGHHEVMVCALDSGLRPGHAIVLCSEAKYFTLTVPLSTRRVIRCLQTFRDTWQNTKGETLQWTCNSHQGRRSDTPGGFMLKKPGHAATGWATQLELRLKLTFTSDLTKEGRLKILILLRWC